MKNIFILLILPVALTSCYHVYYAPNTAHAPLMSKKGETRINALYAAGGHSEYNGAELQVAHAVNNSVALMVNGFAASKSEEGDNSWIEKGSGSYIEFAGGMFHAFDPRGKWIGEIYGGAGFGAVKNDYGLNDHSKTGITKFFVQPSIGYKSSNFEFAFVPRLSYINWKVKKEMIRSSENYNHQEELSVIRSDPDFFAFEPAFILRGGDESFKVQLGMSFSNYRHTDIYVDLAEALNFSIGISVNILSNYK